MALKGQQILNILAIRMSALGDLIHCDGALRDLRNFYPKAHITLLVKEKYVPYVLQCPWVDTIIADKSKGFWGTLRNFPALMRHFRHRHFDKVIDFHRTWRTKIYCRIFLKKKMPSLRLGQDRFEQYAHILQEAGGVHPITHTFSPNISWLADDMRSFLNARGFEQDKPLIVLCHSCSHKYRKVKIWPFYAPLARQLQTMGCHVVTIPGPGEAPLDEGIPALYQSNGRELNFAQMAGVLKEATYVVGNDTGPTHMAAWLDKNGLILFGSHRVKAAQTGILKSKFDVIERSNLVQITVSEVLEKVVKWINLQKNGEYCE